MQEIQHSSDSVKAFIDTCLERKLGTRTERTVMYLIYENYCRESGRIPGTLVQEIRDCPITLSTSGGKRREKLEIVKIKQFMNMQKCKVMDCFFRKYYLFNSIQILVPFSELSSMNTLPLCNSMMLSTSASPKPTPPISRLLALSTR